MVEAADGEIFSEDIPGWLVANEGKLTVALEVTVTDELKREGIARELVNLCRLRVFLNLSTYCCMNLGVCA